MASSGRPPAVSIRAGVEAGPSYVWTVGDVPCAVFGAVPIGANTASIWMVGTDALDSHKMFLLRHARPWVERLNARWHLLVNRADARNSLHHRFIRWTGFTFFRECRVNGLRFYDFAKINTSHGLRRLPFANP